MEAPQPIDTLALIIEHARLCNMTPYKLMLAAGKDPSNLARWKNKKVMPKASTLNEIRAKVPIPDVALERFRPENIKPFRSEDV